MSPIGIEQLLHEVGVLESFSNFLFVLSGIALWEIVKHLAFDWSLICGRRRRPWTCWIYLACRFSALAAIAVGFAMPLGTTIPIHCRAWMIFVSLFIDAAYALSTFMVVIRIAAIWDKNRPVMFVAVVAWSSVLGIYLRNIISPSASNSDLAKSLPKSFATCITLDSAQARETSIVTLSSYLVLLFIMMVGLQRTRGASPLAMWNMLYRQGLVWLALALISEVTVIIIISSNIGPIVDMLIQMPRVLITSLGATHMYRALYNFSAMNDIQCQMIRDWDHLTQPDPMLRRRSMDVSTGTKFPFLPLEVEIHVASEQR